MRRYLGPQGIIRYRWLVPHAILTAAICDSFLGGAILIKNLFWWYVLVVVLDLITAPTVKTDQRTALGYVQRKAPVWQAVMVAGTVIYVAFVFCGLRFIIESQLTIAEVIFISAAFGFLGAVCVIPTAHELMHLRSAWGSTSSVIIMLTFSYPHFCIEHISGHHRYVATTNDGASARLGEGFYAFFARTISWGAIDAWMIEADRLRRTHKWVWGLRNRIINYFVMLVFIYLHIGWAAGSSGIWFFAIYGAVGISLVEATNYIQHYGLTRAPLAAGDYEAIGAAHSWDSHHRMSNLLLMNLPQHSHHHIAANATFTKLEGLREAPELPLGYFALFAVALLPPIWRRLMDPRVVAWRERQETQSRATKQTPDIRSEA